MGVFNIATPAGTDPINQGDDRIRELKTAIQEALQSEGSFPGASPLTAPKYIWTIRSGNTASRPASPVTGQLYHNTQLETFERYNGASWDALAANAAASIDADALAASVAGSGLAGGAGTPLSVNVDGTTIEIDSDTLRIAATAAGSGLTGGGGSALAVNPDNSTIEISADAVQIKDAGVTETKLATAVVNKLGQNLGLVARVSRSSNGDLLNYTGQGRLRGIAANAGWTGSVEVIVDGTSLGTIALGGSQKLQYAAASTSVFVAEAGEGTLTNLDLNFRTSLQLVVSGYIGGTVYAQYERQA